MYESDEYYFHLEEEILANFEDEKNELIKEIEYLNRKLNEFNEQYLIYFNLINISRMKFFLN